jgi:hypothetical protein
MDIEKLGQVAYIAYFDTVGGEKFRNIVCLDWKNMSETDRNAWCQVAAAVINFKAPVPSDKKEVGK